MRSSSFSLPPPSSLLPPLPHACALSRSDWDNQDAVAIIKRRLQLLLPGVRIFLDVDDLQSTDDIERCVGSSACVLVLLGSPKYFTSANCMREIGAAEHHGLPLILVHDSDPSKVCSSLAELRAACPPEHLAFIFGAGAAPHSPERVAPHARTPDSAGSRWSDWWTDRSSDLEMRPTRFPKRATSMAVEGTGLRPVIPWHRLRHFQMASLASIAEKVLLASPAYQHLAAMSLKVPRELVWSTPRFSHPIAVYTSIHNEGALEVASELIGASAPTPTPTPTPTPWPSPPLP